MRFTKMSGSGNDFVVVDNRTETIRPDEASALARLLSRPRLSVGADGLVLLSTPADLPQGLSYSWRYVNADGSDGEMCGNGAMCAARFAVESGIAPADHAFLTPSGPVHAKVDPASGNVSIAISPPGPLTGPIPVIAAGRELAVWQIQVGVPHSVVFVEDADAFASPNEFHEIGRAVRYHEAFAPAGTNLNVVSPVAPDHWRMRTWERGVEAETLACGTGAVASSLVIAATQGLAPPIRIRTSGGRDLVVTWQQDQSDVTDVELTGHAAIIYTADLGPDALLDQDSSQNTRRNSAES